MKTLAEYFTASGIQSVEPWTHDINIIFPEDRDPMPHQMTGLNQAIRSTRFGLYDEQGCGKSLISHTHAVWYSCEGNRCIALMEPTLLKQYYDEFHEVLSGIEKHITMKIYRGKPKVRAKMREQWESEGFPDIVLMSYNIFRETLYTRTQIEEGAYPDRTWMYFKRHEFNVLTADEATILKKPSSNSHKACHQFLGKEGESALLLMTGTPSENTLIDLYGLIRLTNPRAYGSLRNFQRLHVIYNPYSDYPQIEGYRNLDLLTINLYAKGRRVEKKDVMKDLPKKLYTEYTVDLDPAHLTLYRRLAKERMLEIGDEIIDAELEQSLRQKLMEIVCNPHLFTDKTMINEPIRMCQQLVESIGTNTHKVMIYFYRKATAETLMDAFSHLNPVLINSTTATHRDKYIKRFQEDDSCRLFICNYLSAGKGLNFQKVCSHMIFMEPYSVPGIFFQATDRIHRGVMTTPPNYYLITVMNTVMVKIRNSMVEKHDTNKLVTKDTSSLDEMVHGSKGLVGSFKGIEGGRLELENLSTDEIELVNFGGI